MSAAGVLLEVVLDSSRGEYLPLEEVRGVARWWLAEPAELLEVRLFWGTEGRGDRDFAVVASEPIPRPPRQGEHRFAFRLPAGPYSFSGRLVSLLWAIELVHPERELAGGVGLVVGPGRREVRIDGEPAEPGAGTG